MATLTVSTRGLGLRPYGGGETPECHKVEDIRYSRFTGDFTTDRGVAVLTLEPEQALAVAYDLLYQAVDAGAIDGWSVQHAAA